MWESYRRVTSRLQVVGNGSGLFTRRPNVFCAARNMADLTDATVHGALQASRYGSTLQQGFGQSSFSNVD